MKRVLIIVAVIVIIVLLVPLLFPGSYHVKRNMVIHADAALVYEKVADFKQWPEWSPWIILDKSTRLTYSGNPKEVGSKYTWESDVIGAGEMEVMEIKGTERLNYDLRFTKPWKSESKVYVELSEKDGGVNVLWGMTGSMGYFMRFMNGMMDSYIGMDYERGLKMLKRLCEDSVVHSKITYGEVQQFDGVKFIGIRHKVNMSEIGNLMDADFKALQQLFKNQGLSMGGAPMSVYYSMDMKTRDIDFATAFVIDDAEGLDIPDEFYVGELPAKKVFTIIHHGDYELIGNAWSAAYQYASMKKLKPDMKAVSWEVYTNDPHNCTSPAQYETVVYLPLK